MQRLLKVAVFALSALVLAGCQQGRDAYALTTTNTLIRFDTNNANNITAESTITGLASGETLLQIAFRPANKQLYGITSSNFLVTVNTDTGVTTRVGSTAFSSLSLTVPVIDFNPVGDYLRVINFEGANSANNTNFRVDPTTGAQLQTDGSGTLSFVSNDIHEGEIPRLAAIAYSNSVDDATSTTLYAIDVTTQTLESATTAGVLTTIGAANNGFTANAGIDIVPNNDKAYAAIADRNGSARFYQLNLGDGTTSSGDNIGSGLQIRSLAVTLDEPKRKGFNF